MSDFEDPYADEVEQKSSVPITELSIGKTFAHAHADTLRYCDELKGWLAWNGTHYAPDSEAKVFLLLTDFLSDLRHNIHKIPNDKKRQRYLQAIQRHETNPHMVNILAIASRQHPIRSHYEEWDKDVWAFPVQNGVIDLRTGQLSSHDSSRLITKCSPVVYDPDATCPQWNKALRQWFKDDDLLEYVAGLAGTSMTGIQEKMVIVCHGDGNNGKTTFLNLLSYVLGDFATPLKIDALLSRNWGSIPNDIAKLRGARMVVSSEVPEGRRLNESLVKDLTGRDKIDARFLRQEFFSFKPQYTLWLQGNYKPVVRGTDDGIWTRLKLIPFTQKITEIVSDYEEILKTEASGILNWMIGGCLAWQRGIDEPQCVKEATQEYQKDMDVMGQFLGECCVEDATAQVSCVTLYDRYRTWCMDNGIGEQTDNKIVFGRKLGERGLATTLIRMSNKVYRGWRGVGVSECNR